MRIGLALGSGAVRGLAHGKDAFKRAVEGAIAIAELRRRGATT